jgi:hypothetical protein
LNGASAVYRDPGLHRREPRIIDAEGLFEERSAALMAHHGADEACRIRRFGRELKARRGIEHRPFDGRTRLKEISFEIHRLVTNVLVVENATPFHGERDVSQLREAGGEDLGERALQVVIVERLEGELEGSLAAAQGDGDAVVRHRNRPEQPVGCDVGVVVVNLIRSNWTVEHVKSDEPEGRVVVLPVDRDVLPYHEAHIRLEGRRREAGAHADSSDAIESHEPIEIGDLRGVGDIRQRCAGRANGEMVDEDSKR